MNFGYEDLRTIIYNQLVAGGANIPIGRGKFSKDLAKKIHAYIEDNMNPEMKAIALSRGVPIDVLKFSERCGKALGFHNMPLDPVSIDAYRWIMEQAQTIEQFADWARSDEQGKYIAKYRKGAGMIRNDWARAFAGNEGVFTADDIQ